MFEKPWREGVGHRDVGPYPGLKTELECPEEPSHQSDSDLDSSVGLRVVRWRTLSLDVLDSLELSEQPCHASLQTDNGPLVVGFDDDLGVAHPFDVLHSQLRTEMVLVIAFLRDHVREHVFAAHASHQEAFDELASCTCGGDFVVYLALLAKHGSKLVASLDALLGDKKVVHTHHGDTGRGDRNTVRMTDATAFHALLAP